MKIIERAYSERDRRMLLDALRAGRVGMVSIHVPDAAECLAYETIRGDLRRFWRRPKRLEHYA